ncbi:hypothetical protein BRC73_03880, partial [Halobacteriales archaeon QH_7_66_37]
MDLPYGTSEERVDATVTLPHTFDLETTLEQRGLYDVGPPTIRQRGPLGLVERRIDTTETSTLVVYPERYGLARDGVFSRFFADELETERQEFDRLREYTPGDPLRHIHWKSSAKHDEFLVMEFAPTRRTETVTIAASSTPGYADEMARASATFAVGRRRGRRRHPRDRGWHRRPDRRQAVRALGAGDRRAPRANRGGGSVSRSDRTGRWLPVGRIERAGQRWVPGWDRLVAVSLVRAGALAAAGGLLLSFLLVLYDVVATVGEPALFYPAVGLPLLGATLLARSVGVRTALGIGAALLAVGLAYHTATLDGVPDPLLIIASNVELLTGRRVLEIRQAGVWALAVTPTPVFVTWYLTLRREYVGAAAAGGATLGYLILTGDAGTTIALLGVVSVAALVGFGDLDNREWAGGTPDYVAAVLALMVVTPLVITIVPGGAASPVTFVGDEGTTMEDNVVGADSDLQI